MSNKLIVTRYPSLADYLKQAGVVPENTPVYHRVKPEDVKGCHVYGTLPLWLASFADRVTEYVLVSASVELGSIKTEEVGKYLRTPLTYKVERMEGKN